MLREEATAGLEARLAKAGIVDEEARKPYFERLKFETDIIIQMGFPGYFLIVADFIKWAKDHDIPVGPGRGSGAGSVVAWARSEEHTSELQSLMRISYAVFCLKKKTELNRTTLHSSPS